MLDYKAYLTNVIERRDYVLAGMEERIDDVWLDGIKVGSGLAIDANGVLSVDIPDGDSTSY